MQAGILYYSMTGNSALASRRLAAGLPFDSELIDMTKSVAVDLDRFDAVGVVCSTAFWDAPSFVLHFIDQLSGQRGKPAFVANTYGGVSGRALPRLGQAMSAAGFCVVAGSSFHMPDSYPPLLAAGITAAGAPPSSQTARFDAFIAKLGVSLVAAVADGAFASASLSTTPVDKLLGLIGRFVPHGAIVGRTVAVSDCTGCGICVRGCPVGAIEAGSPPAFRAEACIGCWRCYNRCPQHAIRTRWLDGTPFYSGPSDDLIHRLDPAHARKTHRADA